MRRHRKADEQEINLVSGKYLHDFTIALTFASEKKQITKAIDFLPLFHQYVKGDNLRYFSPANFKKFIIQSGSISWGKNEDVIFPASKLLKKKKTTAPSDEILYVI
ncbi:MAG: hypothetical protein AAB221_05385 [Bacteroidota bacterium]